MNYQLVGGGAKHDLTIDRIVMVGMPIRSWGGRTASDQLDRAFIRQIYVGDRGAALVELPGPLPASVLGPDAFDVRMRFPKLSAGQTLTVEMTGGWVVAFALCECLGIDGHIPLPLNFARSENGRAGERS